MQNRRRGKTLTTNIPIYTLSGGVGRQAPSKRLPSEAQELINALCTVERSIEKRPGTDLMPIRGISSGSLVDTWTADALGLDGVGPYEFFWHSLSDELRYLIVVDRGATTSANKLYYIFYYNQTKDYFENHTPDSPTIPDEVRAYITYAGISDLKLVTLGQNLVFLNPDVYAGYTSKPFTFTGSEVLTQAYGAGDTTPTDGTVHWIKIGLDGQPKGAGTVGDPYIEDGAGAELTYTTATVVDPAGIARYWTQYETYAQGTQVLVLPGSQELPTGLGHTGHDNGIHAAEPSGGFNEYSYILQAVTTVAADAEISDNTNWTVIATDNPGWTTGTWPEIDPEREPAQISVKDWEYPDSSTPQYGQSLPTFNDLRLPPLDSDVLYGNNGAQDMLNELYGLEIGVDGDSDGEWDDLTTIQYNSAEGKIYYIQTGYQGQAPGYYIAKSVDAPHMMKVRTPDGYSILDKDRMPMELEFTGVDANGISQWEWSTIDWAYRTSGDVDTNPGPTPFKEGRQAQLKTIAFFRNRLWLSSGDVVFSSQEGNFTDLWLEDPGVIVDTDPIDIAASANTYTPITSMVPFKDYMFVNTNADTQYELMGSENQITPFTAELQPMTFYSTAPLVDPLTLGNHIFFYDAERLYLYLGRGGSLSTAQELSTHCPKYLPSNFGATAVAAAQDTILAVDADSPSDVYLYTTRYRGNEIVQNSFYRFEYDGADIQSMKAWDNYVYMVAKRGDSYFIERQYIRYDEPDMPRIDRKQKLTMNAKDTVLNGTDVNNPLFDNTAFNCYFSPENVETTVRVPYVLDENEEYLFISSNGVSSDVVSISPESTYTDITVSGNVSSGEYWLGRKYTMLIQLSPQFLRNEQNNPQEGILTIASLLTRHFNTGNYDVVAQRRGRPVTDVKTAYEEKSPDLLAFTTTFAAPQVDTYAESNLSLDNIQYQGELVSKIMGFSDKTEIFILSDYFTPVNITNLQVKGKFKQTYSSII